MWIRFSNWLYQISIGWAALLGVVIFLLFTALVLPAQTARQDSQIGEVDSPDLSIYYTAGELYQMAESYGAEGRIAYIRIRFTFDLIWPVIYTIFLATSISWVYQRAFEDHSRWRLANLVPILGMFFDYAENIATSIVMVRFPDTTPLVEWLAGFFTTLKWVFIGGSFLLLISGMVIIFWEWVFRSRKSVDEN